MSWPIWISIFHPSLRKMVRTAGRKGSPPDRGLLREQRSITPEYCTVTLPLEYNFDVIASHGTRTRVHVTCRAMWSRSRLLFLFLFSVSTALRDKSHTGRPIHHTTNCT